MEKTKGPEPERVKELVKRARAKIRAERLEQLRRVIFVTRERTLVGQFGRARREDEPRSGRSCEPIRFEDVIGEILGLLASGDLDAPELLGGGPGIGARDLAIWQDRRLIAVVHARDEGAPVVTRFGP